MLLFELCFWGLQSWGCAHTAFAGLTSALGREFVVVFSPWKHQQCLPQLQGYRDLKLWLSLWHWCLHASCLPSLVENGSDDSFLTWLFLFSSPSYPGRENCLQASGVAEISPPSSLCPGGGGNVCVVGKRRGQLCCLLCFGDPHFCWSCSTRGQPGICCRVMKGTLGRRIGQQACCKQRETLAKEVSETCVSLLVEQLSVLF